MPRHKLEPNGYAIIRESGIPCRLKRKIKLPGYTAWETDCGEYESRELRATDAEGFARAEYAADLADWNALCDAMD